MGHGFIFLREQPLHAPARPMNQAEFSYCIIPDSSAPAHGKSAIMARFQGLIKPATSPMKNPSESASVICGNNRHIAFLTVINETFFVRKAGGIRQHRMSKTNMAVLIPLP